MGKCTNCETLYLWHRQGLRGLVTGRIIFGGYGVVECSLFKFILGNTVAKMCFNPRGATGCRALLSGLLVLASLWEIVLDFSNILFGYPGCEEWHSLNYPSLVYFMILLQGIITMGCHTVDRITKEPWRNKLDTSWWITAAWILGLLFPSAFTKEQGHVSEDPHSLPLLNFCFSSCVKVLWKGVQIAKYFGKTFLQMYINELWWTGGRNLFYKPWWIEGLINVTVYAFLLLLLRILNLWIYKFYWQITRNKTGAF